MKSFTGRRTNSSPVHQLCLAGGLLHGGGRFWIGKVPWFLFAIANDNVFQATSESAGHVRDAAASPLVFSPVRSALFNLAVDHAVKKLQVTDPDSVFRARWNATLIQRPQVSTVRVRGVHGGCGIDLGWLVPGRIGVMFANVVYHASRF